MWRMLVAAFTPMRITMQDLCLYVFAFVSVIDSQLTSNTTSEGSFMTRQPWTEQNFVDLFKGQVDDKLCPQTSICHNRPDMTRVYENSKASECCKGKA
ncbi:hypothetical protein DPMN_054398 [Dreissena polymorpha]|uniref:Secreted protein n=1 Tax=Dreissena polymorpha TaxID=45954 RepID=A0A9D4HPQ7_DREPO|nr:hypothetical protein DPMN_054398 [Dreissena polymorpha]